MILIAKAHLEEIEQQAVSTLPGECCGLLIGRVLAEKFTVTRLIPSPNQADGHDRFEIDPALHLKYQRNLRGSGVQVIGLYHSHPTGNCTPSDRDLAAACYPGWIWLITRISGKKKPLTKAWRFFDDAAGRRFEEETLVSK